MINLGIIGAGNIAHQHALALREVSALNLIAACRTDADALNQFCSKFGVQGYTDYRQLLANDSIDAVLIATPHHLHSDIAIHAAQCGKHIMIEKPFALSSQACDAVIAAAETAGVMLMVGHTKQFSPASQTAKNIVQSGRLGNIVMGQGTMCKFWMGAERQPWHLSSNGGGVLTTAGIHYIDLLTFLVDSKVTCVKATLNSRIHNHDADDAGMLFLQYENGVAVSILSLGYRQGVAKMQAELFCEEGVLRVSDADGVFIGRDEKWELVEGSYSKNWMHESLVSQWRAFSHCLNGKDESPVSGAYAQHVIAIVAAAFESARSGKEIRIPSRSNSEADK